MDSWYGFELIANFRQTRLLPASYTKTIKVERLLEALALPFNKICTHKLHFHAFPIFLLVSTTEQIRNIVYAINADSQIDWSVSHLHSAVFGGNRTNLFIRLRRKAQTEDEKG